MTYQSSPIGHEISCVMYGISAETLNDCNKLEKILLEALKQDNFTILNKISHKFQPQGYTLAVLLAESHATIHTYPEYNSLFFCLYSCREQNDGRKTFEHLKTSLNPSFIDANERPVIIKNTGS